METGTVIVDRKAGVKPTSGNTIEEALRRGWIEEYSTGQYIYRREWTKLLRRFQDIIRLNAINTLGFEEWIFPRLVPREALENFKLTQFTPDLLIQAHSDRDLFLDPVQCVSLYHSLRGRTLPRSNLPLKVVECLGGWTWRNEKTERLDGPYRAIEFLRVEHVYIGSPEEVTMTRRLVRDGLLGILTKLGLGWNVVVGDGCMEIPSIVERQKGSQHPDEVPVQDIEVPVNGALRKHSNGGKLQHTHGRYYQGKTVEEIDDDFYLDSEEICGCSVEGDHLIRDFNISADDGMPVWSGCVGIGLNRLMVAFLYQHGFSQDNWPDVVTSTASR